MWLCRVRARTYAQRRAQHRLGTCKRRQLAAKGEPVRPRRNTSQPQVDDLGWIPSQALIGMSARFAADWDVTAIEGKRKSTAPYPAIPRGLLGGDALAADGHRYRGYWSREG
jgi:hypothetical protein